MSTENAVPEDQDLKMEDQRPEADYLQNRYRPLL